jgi:hypothetical protein
MNSYKSDIVSQTTEDHRRLIALIDGLVAAVVEMED